LSAVSQPARKLRGISFQASRPEEAIAYLLKSLQHSLRQAVDEAFRRERIDMSFAHLAVLYALESEPGLAGAELARRIFVTAQTMNTILRRLERDRDIERRPHPATPRADSWYVTKTGTVRLAGAKIVGGAVWSRMLGALREREVTQLQSLLERCIGGLDAQIEDAPANVTKLRTRARPRGAARRR
jgi:DNA-binding MarR family transcriptional regulator